MRDEVVHFEDSELFVLLPELRVGFCYQLADLQSDGEEEERESEQVIDLLLGLEILFLKLCVASRDAKEELPYMIVVEGDWVQFYKHLPVDKVGHLSDQSPHRLSFQLFEALFDLLHCDIHIDCIRLPPLFAFPFLKITKVVVRGLDSSGSRESRPTRVKQSRGQRFPETPTGDILTDEGVVRSRGEDLVSELRVRSDLRDHATREEVA